MKVIDKRSDEKYIKIEKFDKYELTNCIVHEMKERELGNKPSESYNQNTKGYVFHEIGIENIFLSKKNNLKDYIFTIYPSLYNDMEEKIKNDNPVMDDSNIEQLLKNTPIVINDIIQKYIKNDDKKFQTIFFENDENKIEKLTKARLIEIIEQTSFAPAVTPDFSYDPVEEKYHKYITLYNINLALPLDELMAYLEKIKKDYDKNKLKIEMPVDVIDKNYSQDENIYTIEDRNRKRYRKITVLKKNGDIKEIKSSYTIFSSEKKVADMLFIYDQLDNGFKKSEILTELQDYHTAFGEETFEFYKATAEEYIDNEYYKYLVSDNYK